MGKRPRLCRARSLPVCAGAACSHGQAIGRLRRIACPCHPQCPPKLSWTRGGAGGRSSKQPGCPLACASGSPPHLRSGFGWALAGAARSVRVERGVDVDEVDAGVGEASRHPHPVPLPRSGERRWGLRWNSALSWWSSGGFCCPDGTCELQMCVPQGSRPGLHTTAPSGAGKRAPFSSEHSVQDNVPGLRPNRWADPQTKRGRFRLANGHGRDII
jgi:hypothetical protein